MPCLHDLLEFRRAELVPWFADLLAFFLIAFIVQSVLPLRVVVQGSALEWVHTRLCQLER